MPQVTVDPNYLPADYQGTLFPVDQLSALTKLPINSLTKQALAMALGTVNPQIGTLTDQQKFDILTGQQMGADLMRNAAATGAAMKGVPEAVGKGYRDAAAGLNDIQQSIMAPLTALAQQSAQQLQASGAPTVLPAGQNLNTLPVTAANAILQQTSGIPGMALENLGAAAQHELSLLPATFTAAGANQAALAEGAAMNKAQGLQPAISRLVASLPGLTQSDLGKLTSAWTTQSGKNVQALTNIYKAGGFGLTPDQAAGYNAKNMAKNMDVWTKLTMKNADVMIQNAKNQTSVSNTNARTTTQANIASTKMTQTQYNAWVKAGAPKVSVNKGVVTTVTPDGQGGYTINQTITPAATLPGAGSTAGKLKRSDVGVVSKDLRNLVAGTYHWISTPAVAGGGHMEPWPNRQPLKDPMQAILMVQQRLGVTPLQAEAFVIGQSPLMRKVIEQQIATLPAAQQKTFWAQLASPDAQISYQ